ncbi:MAG: NTP transferase domain-containing protein [Candidatus Cloacimonetes bacterium]|nr:NTP transferase domain-containing protein [Candidatus Cloacimonadota bacterium]
MNNNREKSAIILAAGKGTRMKSDKPKVVFPIAGKPMIERVVNTALKSDCSRLIIVVGYKMDQVKNAIPANEKIIYAEQYEQKGTGHAVMVTEENLHDFTGDVFILAGDVPLLSSNTLNLLHEQHVLTNADCTVLTAIIEDAGKYGRIVRDNNNRFRKIVEFKDASPEELSIQEYNTGIYCFRKESLFSALKEINCNNMQNEYYLTDTLEIILKRNGIISTMELTSLKEAAGINSQLQLAELETQLYFEIKEKFMNNGVVIENPVSVIIGEDVSIGRDSFIKCNSIIRGDSKIGENTIIGPNCLIVDSVIEDNCELQGYNIVVGAKIEEGTVLEYDKSFIIR